MITKEYPEILLCRFTKSQRAYIRKTAKRNKVSEAEIVRVAIEVVSKGKTLIK